MTLAWVKDALERLAKTFVQTFIAQITASGLGLVEAMADTSTLERAAIAGLAAVLSLVMSWLSTWAGKDKDQKLSPASVANKPS
ncbi:MAG TPA: holin [Acidimicrobiales bacterium]|jgi:hypothetical protein|nr:holin [Acidimicrobiales bacterium]